MLLRDGPCLGTDAAKRVREACRRIAEKSRQVILALCDFLLNSFFRRLRKIGMGARMPPKLNVLS